MTTRVISAVIPAFRAAATIRRTIESCLAELEPRNIVVVLDGPDAALEQAARAVSDGVRIMVLPQNRGAPVCRNTGLQVCETDYVIFLDADDYVEDGFLTAAGQAAQRAGADLVLGRFSFEWPDGGRTTFAPDERYKSLDRACIMKTWLTGGYTPPCAVAWRRDYVRAIGGWDEALAKNQDGDIVFRALMDGPVIAACRDGQGIYVQYENPDRITLKHSRRTLDSQVAVLDKIRLRRPELPFDPSSELGEAYYHLAKLAFTVGLDDIGVSAEGTARSLGLRGQPGPWPHALTATLLGLRGKQKLARIVRRLIGR